MELIGVGVGGLLVGDVLDRAREVAQDIQNGTIIATAEVGIEFRRLIDYAQEVYAAERDRTITQLDRVQRNGIDALNDLVTRAEAGQREILDNLATRALTVANTMLGANHQPQLATFHPTYIRSGRPYTLRCFGNFFHTAFQGYRATLDFGDQQLNTVGNTTQELQFSLPSQPEPAPGQYPIDFRTATLSVPFPSGMLGMRQVQTFDLRLGVLPLSPGRITLHWQTQESRRIEQAFTSEICHVCSVRDCPRRQCPGNTTQERVFKISPTQGFKINTTRELYKPGGIRLYIGEGWAEGKRSGPTLECFDENVTVWRAGTKYKKISPGGPSKQSGHMNFQVLFDEYKIENFTANHEEDVPLNWGDTRAIQWPIGTWRVVFEAFDGTRQEFTGSDETSSPYLRIENRGGDCVIRAVEPEIE